MADIIDWTQDEYTDPISYVDDIIVSCENDSPVAACDNLQAASDKLEQWTVENRMKIQPDKVCWMLVSLSYSHLDREQFSLSYDGKHVRQETEVTYLGEVITG